MANQILPPSAEVINALPFQIVGTPFQKAINRSGRKGERRWFGKFLCHCGREFESDLNSVRSGKRKSCGCLSSRTGKHSITHGMSKTRVYRIWAGMMKRCADMTGDSYARYGGRGIKVCMRWTKFENFYADVGEPPTSKHSLDRYPNNNGNYEPGNIRWATALEQARNTRSNRMITANGETMTLAEWGERLGIDSRIIHLRLKRGWTEQEAIDGTGDKLLRGERNSATKLTAKIVSRIRAEKEKSTRVLAAEYRISQSQVRNILNGTHWKSIPLTEPGGQANG